LIRTTPSLSESSSLSQDFKKKREGAGGELSTAGLELSDFSLCRRSETCKNAEEK